LGGTADLTVIRPFGIDSCFFIESFVERMWFVWKVILVVILANHILNFKKYQRKEEKHMELKNLEYGKLKSETQELVANSLEIYYALTEKNKLYRKDNVASLSLYAGVLRMGCHYLVKSKIQHSTLAGRGKSETMSHTYTNLVCQILNNYGITIEKVIELLDLEEPLLQPRNEKRRTKMENQYNVAYRSLLHTIRNYYIASARITKNDDKAYISVKLTIPNIISAIHYSNINPDNSIWNLNCRLGNLTDGISIKPEHLKELEKHSTYYEEMVKYDKNGKIKDIYQEERPLIMNKSLGKII